MKLYGTPLSNYFSMVKHALLEKSLEFEFVSTRPSQEVEFLAMSPMGKVPVLETEQGFLTETDAILDYLEEAYPEPALMPVDAFARAKVRQLMKTQELYVESPIHDHLILAIFGREVSAEVQQTCREQAQKGMAALGRLVSFSPYICGTELTSADIFAFYSFTLSNRLAMQVLNWNLLAELPGLNDWYLMMSDKAISKVVLADMQEASAALAARQK